MSSINIETVLAFDVGLKRTGVASGQTHTRSANPAAQIPVSNGRMDWVLIDKLLTDWAPSKIVIGDPQSDDTHLNKVINRLKSHIQQNYKIPIVMINETLTTNSANAELAGSDMSSSRKKKLRDQIAACLILESYFSSLP
jgi:putative Holliday junction resolvase